MLLLQVSNVCKQGWAFLVILKARDKRICQGWHSFQTCLPHGTNSSIAPGGLSVYSSSSSHPELQSIVWTIGLFCWQRSHYLYWEFVYKLKSNPLDSQNSWNTETEQPHCFRWTFCQYFLGIFPSLFKETKIQLQGYTILEAVLALLRPMVLTYHGHTQTLLRFCLQVPFPIVWSEKSLRLSFLIKSVNL